MEKETESECCGAEDQEKSLMRKWRERERGREGWRKRERERVLWCRKQGKEDDEGEKSG